MCLLISKPADTVFDEDDIKDFYSYNPDGLGIMYAEGGVLYAFKILPDTAKQAVDFYNKHAIGRDCVIHFRQRTHGEVDLANCHPYEVFGDGSTLPVYVAHNGILPTADEHNDAMSDTWHYIQDYIITTTKDIPEMLFNPKFVEMLGAHIGVGNKLIFVSSDGEMSIVNKKSFTPYKGALMSNTYAWSGGYNYGYKSDYALDLDYAWDEMRKDTYHPRKATVTRLPVQKKNQHCGDERWEWTRTFFEALSEAGLETAYTTISSVEAQGYYDTVGYRSAWALVDTIWDGMCADRDVIDEIERELIRSATLDVCQGSLGV